MKKCITIAGVIDEEEGKINLSKHDLSVPHLIMTITELTKMLYNDLDEEDIEKVKGFLKDIAENPEDELKQQFEAIRIYRLKRMIRSLKKLGEVIEDDERLN